MALPARYTHLVSSKWTSAAPLQGWRQFQVLTVRRGAVGWEVELVAPGEPNRRTWVAAAALSDRARFSSGWATPTETRAVPAAPVEAPAAK